MNYIKGVRDADGNWQVNEGRDSVILDYFKSLFKAFDQVGNMGFLEGLEGRVNAKMNERLSRDFCDYEVYLALKQMNPTKGFWT